jgi:hypothetical protein
MMIPPTVRRTEVEDERGNKVNTPGRQLAKSCFSRQNEPGPARFGVADV